MTIINLREIYPCYTQTSFQNEENCKADFLKQLNDYNGGLLEVSNEVAAALFADKRYHQTHARLLRRHAVHSLDREDGTLEIACIQHIDLSPDAVLGLKDNYCALCRALNSLPDKQGRRIDSHYLHGRSIAEIATAEKVSERNVRKAIYRGLETMRKYLINFQHQGTEVCKNCPDY